MQQQCASDAASAAPNDMQTSDAVRMRKSLWLAAAAAAIAAVFPIGWAAFAQNAPKPVPPRGVEQPARAEAVGSGADQATDLPVRRIAIFSSGVGFFEAAGTIDGDSTAELKFRTEQINDILKSLVVQDLDGGRVGIVSYASQDPIDKTLKSFGVDLTGKPTLPDLLEQLRGEAVEVSGERAVRGIILGVERRQEKVGDSTIEIVLLNLLAEGGLTQIDFRNIRSIRLLNESVDAELRKALATLATTHNADKKTVVLHFAGQGQRRVRAAYLLEAPIWKTSYRLVLSDDKKPFLQGWATVENATEEDWKDVRLSLVSGRPISFRMDLYTPLYVPRPLEVLELYASLRPPSYEGGIEEEQRENGRALAKRSARRDAPAEMQAAAPAPAAVSADDLGGAFTYLMADSGVQSVAAAQEAGELFEYVIETPVTIPRQHSAMLPIVNQEVEGTKVSIYNPATHAKHPLNGLELTNSTDLNLMQGPVTVFDGNTYAGDAKLPNLSPGEERLLAYALDLSTEVIVDQKPQVDELVSLALRKGTLVHRHKYVDSRVYNVKNKAGKPRTLVIEQPYSAEWKLIDPQEAHERTANLLRFRLATTPKETTAFPVTLERYGDSMIALTDLPFETIQIYLRAPVISPNVREALERVVAIRTELDRLRREQQQLEQSLNEANAEQSRVRENIKTLPRDSDQYQRQLKQFDASEAEIVALKQRVADARAKAEAKRRELEEYLVNLTVE